MSQLQKTPEYADDQGQTCEETQGLQTEAVPTDVEDPCPSSHLLMNQTCEENQALKITQVFKDLEDPCSPAHPLAGSKQEDPKDEMPSTSGVLQSPCASSRESPEGLSNQEEQGNPVNPPGLPGPMNLPLMSEDMKVNFLVNYMLYKYQMEGIMSRDEIVRLIVREEEHRFHEILVKAAKRMEMVFGLDVKEVDPVNHYYALFIKLGLTYDGIRSDEYSFPKTGLLIIILGIIFMKGNRATENEIWELMNPMGICAGMNNFLFGDTRQLITELVLEEYLMCQEVPNNDPVQYEFVWGPRAHAETTKMKVLEFVAKLHGTDPTAFPSHFEEAVLDEPMP